VDSYPRKPKETSSIREKRRGEFSPAQLDKLVNQAKNGDLAAFQELYYQYGKRILNYIYRLTNSREDAEDLAQETFVLVYKNLHTLKENARFPSWLYRIAQNNVYQKYRAKVPQMESIDQADRGTTAIDIPSNGRTPEGKTLSGELQAVIAKSIRELPEKYRQVFVLSALHNQSYQAIADILDRSVASIKSDIHRARTSVRDRIKEYMGENYGMSKVF